VPASSTYLFETQMSTTKFSVHIFIWISYLVGRLITSRSRGIRTSIAVHVFTS